MAYESSVFWLGRIDEIRGTSSSLLGSLEVRIIFGPQNGTIPGKYLLAPNSYLRNVQARKSKLWFPRLPFPAC